MRIKLATSLHTRAHTEDSVSRHSLRVLHTQSAQRTAQPGPGSRVPCYTESDINGMPIPGPRRMGNTTLLFKVHYRTNSRLMFPHRHRFTLHWLREKSCEEFSYPAKYHAYGAKIFTHSVVVFLEYTQITHKGWGDTVRSYGKVLGYPPTHVLPQIGNMHYPDDRGRILVHQTITTNDLCKLILFSDCCGTAQLQEPKYTLNDSTS